MVSAAPLVSVASPATRDAHPARPAIDGPTLFRRIAPLLLLFAIPGIPVVPSCLPLAAQDAARPRAASLSGQVVDAETGAPLFDVTVRVLGSDRVAMTDRDGRFTIVELVPGVRTIGVEWDGRVSAPRRIQILPSENTEIRIALVLPPPDADDPRPVFDLPPLGVRIPRGEPPGKLRDFFRRMETEQGHFITREEILDRAPLRTSDLLREVPGVRLARADFDRARLRISRHTGCSVDMFLDGIPTPGLALDDLPPGDIAGIEIYRGASEVPIAFRRRTTCAAILIWTRDPGRP